MRVFKFRAWWPAEKVMEYDLGRDIGNYFENETEVMQFTGLLDKNGREIYEGDIVKHPYVAGPCVIAYSSDAWQGACFVAVGAPDWCLRERPLDEPWEIIGNIYEHPELIKKDQKQ